MAGTMMKRFIRLARLREVVRSNLPKFPATFTSLRSILSSLFGIPFISVVDEHLISPSSSQKMKSGSVLDKRTYASLFRYLHSRAPSYSWISAFDYTTLTSPFTPLIPILPRDCDSLSSTQRDQHTFSTRRHHIGNSHVLVRHPRTGRHCLASITFMFKHKRVQSGVKEEEVFFAVRLFGKLGDEVESPFSRYADLHAALCGPLEEETSEVFALSDVVCHLAVIPLKAGSIPRIAVDTVACIKLRTVT